MPIMEYCDTGPFLPVPNIVPSGRLHAFGCALAGEPKTVTTTSESHLMQIALSN